MFSLVVPPLNAASAGSATKAAVHVPESDVESELVGSTAKLLPVKPPPLLAWSVHDALDGAQGARTENATFSVVDDVTVMLRPWICEPARVIPVCGVKPVMVQPVGAVRLNELTCPLVVLRLNVRSAAAPAGTDDGEIVPTTVPGAARADGATAIAATTSVEYERSEQLPGTCPAGVVEH